MIYLMLLGILIIALCSSSLAQDPCTLQDYKASYTECSDSNMRDLVYYKLKYSNCSDGESIPPPIYDLQCGITCKPGSYLPMGQSICNVCPVGHFSIGGGYRRSSWYFLPDIFKSYYFTSTNRRHNMTGPKWTAQGTFLRSGNITNDQSSVLELSVYIASSSGHISFSYRVNAETTFDGLQFAVDGAVLLPKTSHTANYVTISFPLTFGAHILTWSYIKDFSKSEGEDAAFISMIEIGGEHFADDFCTSCPEGTYTDKENSTSCQPCPANTFSNQTGAASCTPCNSDQYSYSEAGTCITRRPCAEQDYEQFYSQCDAGTRKLNSTWITPVICDTETGVALPNAQTGLECGECTGGTYRNSNTYQCDPCENGTYSNSTTDAECAICPAGTAAIKTFAVTQFDEWVEGSSTDCSGDCSNQGWILHSTYMNSGVGHGSNVNSWFQFNVTLMAPGQISFDYNIDCPSGQCSLSFFNGTTSVVLKSAARTPAIYPLTAGPHSLNWTFSKYDYLTSRNDSANIYRIIVTSTSRGGAINCTSCSPGSFSTEKSTECQVCAPGQQSNEPRTACEVCPEGSYNPVAGGSCLPCGHGTAPFANRTGCNITCMFTTSNELVYDLSPLRGNASHGPIQDSNKQKYYINVCSTAPHMCVSNANTEIVAYACQQSTGKIPNTNTSLGFDIGSIMGWEELPANNSFKTDLGVIMTLTYGALGCPANGKYKHRSSNITFLCDPAAGVGAPVGDGTIEHSLCAYSFVWRTQYACPACRQKVDYDYYYSACQGGLRTKTWYWIHSPPRCHGGSLPAPSTVECTETPTVCSEGQYLYESECRGCPAGQFSVGGGERILQWNYNQLPPNFESTCHPAGACTHWNGGQDGIGTVSSGIGNSVLKASFDLLVQGNISFYYKLYEPNVGSFIFAIDGQEQVLPIANKFNWILVNLPVAKGEHVFEWTFISGSESSTAMPRVGANLKDVTIVGTDYHADTCVPCPAGFKSDENATTCIPCGIDQYSFEDSSSCLPCDPSTAALPKSAGCFSRLSCTEADYVHVFSVCFSNNTRMKSTQYLEPKICVSSSGLPGDEWVSCTPCLPGTYIDPTNAGTCKVCPTDSFYHQNSCMPSPAGSMVLRKKFYFYDNRTSEFPAEMETSCSGDCGSDGWRITGASVDSGYHSDHAVDSWLKLQAEVISQFASISFNFECEAGDRTTSIGFYVDDKYVSSFFDIGSHTENITEGHHVFMWNYHQHQQQRGIVQLSQIVISGSTDTSAGGFVTKCPSGSHSAAGEICTLCPPGSYSSELGAEECDSCPSMTYSSEYGANQCFNCTGDSYSPGGSQYCTNDNCQFSGKIDDKNIVFKLADMGRIGPIRAMRSSFYFNFCNASLIDAPCNPSKPAHACAVEDAGGDQRDWGGYLDFKYNHQAIVSGSKNTTYELSFAYGDKDGCAPNIERSVLFKFQCDTSTDGTPTFSEADSDQCKAVFLWNSRVGCPVCESRDYNTLLGSCVDGMRTAQNVRISDCNGPLVQTMPSQSCATTVEFHIAFVFVIIGVVLALVAAAIIIFVKNRRISEQYSRLKQQSQVEPSDDNL